jgi:hypothetical protein
MSSAAMHESPTRPARHRSIGYARVDKRNPGGAGVDGTIGYRSASPT